MSPSKRRALAPMDANTKSPSQASRVLGSKQHHETLKPSASQSRLLTTATLPAGSISKRALVEVGRNLRDSDSRPTKKPCTQTLNADTTPGTDDVDTSLTEYPEPRYRSRSPDMVDSADTSIFDQSAHDTSHATAITEPEGETVAASIVHSSPPPPTRQRSMTREVARQVSLIKFQAALVEIV